MILNTLDNLKRLKTQGWDRGSVTLCWPACEPPRQSLMLQKLINQYRNKHNKNTIFELSFIEDILGILSYSPIYKFSIYI